MDTNGILQVFQDMLSNLVHITGIGDIFGFGIGGIIIFVVLMYFTFYTIKKVVTNLIVGYITLFAIQYIFHIIVEPTAIMLVLMALFGPIPVIVAAGWHYI